MKPRRRRLKAVFYLILFSVSLYSVSRILGPVVSFASGNHSGGSLLGRLLPSLASGSLSGFLGADGEGESGSVAALLDTVNKLNDQGQTNSAAGQQNNPGGPSISEILGTPPAPGRSNGSTNSSARVIRKTTNSTPKSDPSRIEMKQVEARNLDEATIDSLRKSAISLHTQGKLDEAIAAYRDALETTPGDVGLRVNLAIALYQTGNYERSWAEVHAAQNLGARIPTKFIEALSSKMHDPGA